MNKQKQLTLDRHYTFKTKETTYYHARISSFNDTTLFLSNDWRDSIIVPIKNLVRIDKFRFENRKFVEPLAWIALGATLGLILLPVATIDSGSQGLINGLKFIGIIYAITIPPIFIASRKTKYDLSKKWTLTIKD